MSSGETGQDQAVLVSKSTKKRKHSSKSQILLLSKETKKMRLGNYSAEVRTEKKQPSCKNAPTLCNRRGLADVSNTFHKSGSDSSFSSVHSFKDQQSARESESAFNLAIYRDQSHTSLSKSANNTDVEDRSRLKEEENEKELKSEISEYANCNGHRPSMRPVKSPRLSTKSRYINDVPTLKRRNEESLHIDTSSLDLSKMKSLGHLEESFGYSYSTDFGPCMTGMNSYCSPEKVTTSSLECTTDEDEDEGIDGVKPLNVSDGEISPVLAHCSANFSDVETARRDLPGEVNFEIDAGINISPLEKAHASVDFDDEYPLSDLSLSGSTNKDRDISAENLEDISPENIPAEEREEAQIFSLPPGCTSVPYFNSTLNDQNSGAKNIKEVSDIYDMSAIHESFEDVINETFIITKTTKNYDTVAEIQEALQVKRNPEKTPYKFSENSPPTSPHTPSKITRFTHERQGKLKPKGSTFIMKPVLKNGPEIKDNDNDADIDDDSPSSPSQGPVGDTKRRRRLVKTKAGSPIANAAKYPPKLLKPCRFKMVSQSTSTPVKVDNRSQWFSIDMSAVEPPSPGDLDFPVPQESRIVNSDEIHVSDPSMEDCDPELAKCDQAE